MAVPIIKDKAEVVLGSRFATGSAHRVLYFWHYLAKSVACVVGLVFNFLGRRYFVFPEPALGPWRSQKH